MLLSDNTYVIGITGRRHLPPERLTALTSEIQAFLGEKSARYGTDNITALSSLAEGADMLCAKLALDAGMRLLVPLPMNALEYRKDFSNAAQTEFDCLLSLADKVFVSQPEEQIPENPQRGFFYRQAGIYVAKHCDILLSIWDDVERDTPDGAGTWETIKLAHEYGKPVHCVTL